MEAKNWRLSAPETAIPFLPKNNELFVVFFGVGNGWFLIWEIEKECMA
jgi:hypothetical protein